MTGIYKITNKITNDFYIGSSQDIEGRFKNHLSHLKSNKHHSIHLQRAWNKYKEENFVLEIIELCIIDKLIEREQYWIDTLKPEYNIRIIAESNRGIKKTNEFKEKIRQLNLGKKYSEETKKKIGITKIGNKYLLGYKHTKENKLKISQSLKGHKISEETKEKLRKANKGQIPWNKGIKLL